MASIWPQGGNPVEERIELAVPLYVVVEFDEVVMGEEGGRPRTFFPGDPAKARWVPIPRAEVHSATPELMDARENFPLTLAWALTHWQCQGMNLPLTRVPSARVSLARLGVASWP